MITDMIADFIANTSFRKFPDEAVRVAKRGIMDCVGVTLAGSNEATSQIIKNFVVDSVG